MRLVVLDVWIECNNLVATLWLKRPDGAVVTFDAQRPIKLWEILVDEEALIGLYSLEITMFYGGVFYEEIRLDIG